MTNTNLTLYQVTQSGKTVAIGNLRQCWMYLVNAYGESMTVKEIADLDITIEPVNH